MTNSKVFQRIENIIHVHLFDMSSFNPTCMLMDIQACLHGTPIELVGMVHDEIILKEKND